MIYDTKRVDEVAGGVRIRELTLTCDTPFLARLAAAQATGDAIKDGHDFWLRNTKAKLSGKSIKLSAMRNEGALADAELAFDKLQEAANQVEEQLRSGVLTVLAYDLQEAASEVCKHDGRLIRLEDEMNRCKVVDVRLSERIDNLEREAETAAADFDARLETADAEIGVLREENSALKLLVAQLEERIAAIEAQRRDRWYLRLGRWIRRDS